jgi:hypothetical protein
LHRSVDWGKQQRIQGLLTSNFMRCSFATQLLPTPLYALHCTLATPKNATHFYRLVEALPTPKLTFRYGYIRCRRRGSLVVKLLLTIIHSTCISLSLRRNSAHIHLTILLGVLGTQVISCILIARLLERNIFDIYLSEFDKRWVINLKETCRCFTNLCT